jgi:phosphoribosyl-ATP pyrophosphohydrolase/phosphoribosyl-AMP cyclohydrolase
MSFEPLDPHKLDWAKGDGLLPAIVQDRASAQVLMLGFMNEQALAKTMETGKVTFFSRTKGRLWTKGETSGDFLNVRSLKIDCDQDTILIQVDADGPTCHLGAKSCFGDEPPSGLRFLSHLEALVAERRKNPPAGSYTAKLFEAGVLRIAQKVGEEGLETALAAAADQPNLKDEAADLLFHLLVLLAAKDIELDAVIDVLRERHR